jgi:pilus assembly protein Flp/PilA
MKDARFTPLSLGDLIADEDGATLIEYGLVAALVSVFILGAIGALGDAVVQLFDAANQALPN